MKQLSGLQHCRCVSPVLRRAYKVLPSVAPTPKVPRPRDSQNVNTPAGRSSKTRSAQPVNPDDGRVPCKKHQPANHMLIGPWTAANHWDRSISTLHADGYMHMEATTTLCCCLTHHTTPELCCKARSPFIFKLAAVVSNNTRRNRSSENGSGIPARSALSRKRFNRSSS